MATKIWTTKADFDTGSLSNVVDHRNNDLQLSCAWSTGGDLNTARNALAGCGTQTAGLSFGGWINIEDYWDISDVTEEYNGTSWCSAGALNTASKYLAGCGTQTAGLSFGGYLSGQSDITEEYNGTAWTTSGVGTLLVATERLAGCGTQTAGLSFGGNSSLATTGEYDGTSWSAGGDLLTGRYFLAGCGTQTAGLSFGGYSGEINVNTEEYDGSVWASGGDLNTARYGLAGCGTQDEGLSFGGYTDTYSAATEEYDGTSWVTGGDLITARNYLAGAGTQTSGLSFGGNSGSSTSATEEYNLEASGTWTVDFDSGAEAQWNNLSWSNVAGGSVKARVKSATSQGNLDGAAWYPIAGWATAADLNSPRGECSATGSQSAAVTCGGWSSVALITEEYNGTSWCTGGDLNITRRRRPGGGGTQIAAFVAGGYSGSNLNTSEEYNGTSWCSSGNISQINAFLAGAGTQTAGLIFGGLATAPFGGATNRTEEFDGSSWSLGGNLNTARGMFGGSGVQTDAICVGGYTGAADVKKCEIYNGTSWSSQADLNEIARGGLCGGSNDALSFGGGSTFVTTEEFNGTSWAIKSDCIVGVNYKGGAGTSSSALAVGGGSGTNSDKCEEYDTFYTTQPVNVECLDNQWYRLEVTLEEGSTPEVQQVSQEYQLPGEQITANAEICLNVPLYANARIHVFIGITANGRIQPVITANAEITLNVPLYGNARIQPSINADGRIQPIISANSSIVCPRQLGGNWQRKMWYLAPYYWRARYDLVNLRLIFEYIHEDDLDGDNWAENENARIDASGFTGLPADFTVRGSDDGRKTTIHYADGTDTYVAEADDEVTNPITWSWANTTKVFDGVADSCNYRHINLASNRATVSYFHATAVFDDGTNYYVRDKEQTASGNITGWDAAVDVSSNANTDYIYGSSVRSIGTAGAAKNDMMFVWKEGGHLKGRFYDGANWASNAEQTIDATSDTYKAKFDLEHCLYLGTHKHVYVVYVDSDGTIKWTKREAGPNVSESWSAPVTLCDTTSGHASVGIVYNDDEDHYVLWKESDNVEYRKYNDVDDVWDPALAEAASIWDPSTMGIIKTTTLFQLQTPDKVCCINDILITWVGDTGADDCGIGWGIFREGDNLEFIGADGRIQPIISSNAEICLNVPLDANARIQPSINADGRIQPSITADGRIQPIITANAEIVGNVPLYATARIQPSISANGIIAPIHPLYANGRIQPSINADGRIQPTISANAEICLNVPLYATARIQPTISANAEICLNVPLYADGRIQPSISADGRIQPCISADGRIQPTISANAEICLNVPLYANARIQPCISSNAEICLNVPLYATAIIQPTISADGRIRPIITSNGEIVGNVPLYATAIIQPSIAANAEICLNVPLYTTARIQPTISANAEILTSGGCKIVVVGGGNYYDLCELYDEWSDVWSIKTSMPTGRADSASGYIRGKIHFIRIKNIDGNSRIRPVITGSGKIVPSVPNLYVTARIQPVISSIGRIRPAIESKGRVRPSIPAVAKIQGTIQAYGRVRPIITTLSRIIPTILSKGRVRPIITALGKIVENTSIDSIARICYAKFGYGLIASSHIIARILKRITSNARIRLIIVAVANIRPAIKANGRIRPVITALARIFPGITSKGRIRPIMTAQSRIRPVIPAVAKICPTIGGNAEIVYIIKVVARIQPSIKTDGKIKIPKTANISGSAYIRMAWVGGEGFPIYNDVGY